MPHPCSGMCRAALLLLLLLGPLLLSPCRAAEKWSGVDETVVGKISAEHGRTGRPLIGLEGDAQLFAFLLAGAAGGFAAGYAWRMLVAEKRKK